MRIFRASDDFAASAALTGLPPRLIRRAEERLAGRAHHVVCVSPPLIDRWRASAPSVVLIPNGCDVATLRAAPESPRPPDLRLDGPVVGYVGLLSEQRIDFAILHGCLDRGWSLLLAGERRSDLTDATWRALVERPGVQWVGPQAFADLVPYLGAMDVGVVPYRDTDFNRSSSPLKTLEYLAAGLPVVAADLAAIRALGVDHITLASDTEPFLDAVAAAISAGSPPDLVADRIAAAEPHSWDQRAAAYLELL